MQYGIATVENSEIHLAEISGEVWNFVASVLASVVGSSHKEPENGLLFSSNLSSHYYIFLTVTIIIKDSKTA